jgi:hypothetical protein
LTIFLIRFRISVLIIIYGKDSVLGRLDPIVLVRGDRIIDNLV